MGTNQRSKPFFLCFDVGSSSIKAGIIDVDGNLLAWEHEGLLGAAEANLENWNPELWLSALRKVTGRLLNAAALGGGRALHPAGAVGGRGTFPGVGALAGAVFSGNGPTIVGTDERGMTVGAAELWLNHRELRRDGTSSFFLPKIAWLKENRPDLYECTATYFSFPEFLYFRACGEKVTITPSAEFTRFYWTGEELAAYGIAEDKVSPFVRVGERIGAVGAKGSEATGLPEGTPLYAGGSDFLMSLLGTGAVRPGVTCDRAGTSEGINTCVAQERQSPRIRCLPHVIEGLYNAAGILSSTGRIFEWFRSISGQEGKSYGEMIREILELGHDRAIPLFFPSLHAGETWEFSGAIFSGLEPDHGPREMGRAVVLSIGFGVRDLVETLEASSCRINALRACGGQARNALWNQMKADIIGKEIAVPAIVDAELLGDACAGFTGIGEFGSLREGSERLVAIERRFHPDEAEHRRYSEEYAAYEERCRRIMAASIETAR